MSTHTTAEAGRRVAALIMHNYEQINTVSRQIDDTPHYRLHGDLPSFLNGPRIEDSITSFLLGVHAYESGGDIRIRVDGGYIVPLLGVVRRIGGSFTSVWDDRDPDGDNTSLRVAERAIAHVVTDYETLKAQETA